MPTDMVDVRDMLCAQALAVVAQALDRLTAGQPMDVLYNADDVRRDLFAWARGRGHAIQDVGGSTLRLQRHTPRRPS